MKFDITFEEAKQYMVDFERTPLHSKICDEAPQFDEIIRLIVTGIESAINGEELPSDKKLGGGDDRILSNVIVKMPFLYFLDEFDNIDSFLATLMLLCSNYYNYYNPQSCVMNVLPSIQKLLQTSCNVQKMIVAMDYAISRLEKSREYNKFADTGMSQQFLDSILGNKLDF